MTDLNAESEFLPLQPVREEWKGHKVGKLNVSLIFDEFLQGDFSELIATDYNR